jgi:hypothetical protein
VLEGKPVFISSGGGALGSGWSSWSFTLLEVMELMLGVCVSLIVATPTSGDEWALTTPQDLGNLQQLCLRIPKSGQKNSSSPSGKEGVSTDAHGTVAASAKATWQDLATLYADKKRVYKCMLARKARELGDTKLSPKEQKMHERTVKNVAEKVGNISVKNVHMAQNILPFASSHFSFPCVTDGTVTLPGEDHPVMMYLQQTYSSTRVQLTHVCAKQSRLLFRIHSHEMKLPAAIRSKLSKKELIRLEGKINYANKVLHQTLAFHRQGLGSYAVSDLQKYRKGIDPRASQVLEQQFKSRPACNGLQAATTGDICANVLSYVGVILSQATCVTLLDGKTLAFSVILFPRHDADQKIHIEYLESPTSHTKSFFNPEAKSSVSYPHLTADAGVHKPVQMQQVAEAFQNEDATVTLSTTATHKKPSEDITYPLRVDSESERFTVLMTPVQLQYVDHILLGV